jgi:hypothetical protein
MEQALTGKSEADVVVRWSREIEFCLREHYGARGMGLGQMVESARDQLPHCLLNVLCKIAHARNDFIHNAVSVGDLARFQRLCRETLEDLVLLDGMRKKSSSEVAPCLDKGKDGIPESTEARATVLAKEPEPSPTSTGSLRKIHNELAELRKGASGATPSLKMLEHHRRNITLHLQRLSETEVARECEAALCEVERTVMAKYLQSLAARSPASIASAKAICSELDQLLEWGRVNNLLTAAQEQQARKIKKCLAYYRARTSLEQAVLEHEKGAMKQAEKHVADARAFLEQDWAEFLPGSSPPVAQFVAAQYTNKLNTGKLTPP